MATLDSFARVSYNPKTTGNNAEGIRLLNAELATRPPKRGEIYKRLNSRLFPGNRKKEAEKRG